MGKLGGEIGNSFNSRFKQPRIIKKMNNCYIHVHVNPKWYNMLTL